MQIQPVILAGGSGTRLWPQSRTLSPKQFQKFDNQMSLFQQTLNRVAPLDARVPLVVSGEAQRFDVIEQLKQQQLADATVILEPEGRNTAPAIALAALHVVKAQGDALLLVLPSDHAVRDRQRFCQQIEQAAVLAERGDLVTFGINASSPHTGYGYIRRGEPCGGGAYQVRQFVEKPDHATALSYISTGEYSWNSGMFLFKATRYLAELQQWHPDIYHACEQAMATQVQDMTFVRPNAEAFTQCPSDSIDYAVMEKTDSAVVLPLSVAWSDVGNWEALWDIAERNHDNNVVWGDVVANDTQDCFISSQSRLVAAIGCRDLVIVETKDALLVADRSKAQSVKEIVAKLQHSERAELNEHKHVFRLWGGSDTLAEGENYKVKKVTVSPGQSTARQIHYHRAEHWIVVSGVAQVWQGEQCYLVTENESTYIPKGVSHSFENPGSIPLVMVEVWTGTYLDESDIFRPE
uniref:mannose-1-phosphate guanylyltransferase/mannose-6-phosphate isomerase n=1 Tax=Thaumasiovibrio occultus TaxID=1891184 RepID=UPI000D3C30F0|nr:mannose-1-phosphate guanylyltransferase/mannose-6-phosphate isomerase [Thaumasiovibrio occultus]